MAQPDTGLISWGWGSKKNWIWLILIACRYQKCYFVYVIYTRTRSKWWDGFQLQVTFTDLTSLTELIPPVFLSLIETALFSEWLVYRGLITFCNSFSWMRTLIFFLPSVSYSRLLSIPIWPGKSSSTLISWISYAHHLLILLRLLTGDTFVFYYGLV